MAINNTAREIASGMAYLHGMDILHGDLTAGNILLSSADAADARGFTAKVADFGLSRVMVWHYPDPKPLLSPKPDPDPLTPASELNLIR